MFLLRNAHNLLFFNSGFPTGNHSAPSWKFVNHPRHLGAFENRFLCPWSPHSLKINIQLCNVFSRLSSHNIGNSTRAPQHNNTFVSFHFCKTALWCFAIKPCNPIFLAIFSVSVSLLVPQDGQTTGNDLHPPQNKTICEPWWRKRNNYQFCVQCKCNKPTQLKNLMVTLEWIQLHMVPTNLYRQIAPPIPIFNPHCFPNAIGRDVPKPLCLHSSRLNFSDVLLFSWFVASCHALLLF